MRRLLTARRDAVAHIAARRVRRQRVSPRRALSATLADKRAQLHKELAVLPEVLQRAALEAQLRDPALLPRRRGTLVSLGDRETALAVDAGLATFLLHVEARIAAYCGEGFYTIGPGGEEALGAAGLALAPTDGSALHYRHLATQLARQLAVGDESLESMILARARGYCVSASDPVTGGAHCALGGGPHDYIVTSTLASQAPAAVGRALAPSFLRGAARRAAGDAIQYVSLGDGSVNNAHFLAAANLAEYAAHRGVGCGVVFAVSDNDRCISLRGHGWLREFVTRRLGGAAAFFADGTDAHEVYAATSKAAAHARSRAAPAVVVFENLPRRFGHAATDRQSAYLSAEEIAAAAARDPLAELCADALDRGVLSRETLLGRFRTARDAVTAAFDAAAAEPKLDSRAAMVARVAAPLAPLPEAALARSSSGRADVLRKHANRALDELLAAHDDVAYIGEDVEHGGYYLVTEGLAAKHGSRRVRDFPPDETTLLGAAVGLAQRGLVPIVEIPYAKYLDCGADVFYELAIAHWLSNGQRPNGMVIRLQGFDRGLFGGNFHTHNELRLPPGVDAICHSNGADYARGLRYALRQARAGRVVMSVDSTYLLNLRHVDEAARDNAWLAAYPGAGEEYPFDAVTTHADPRAGGPRVAVVTYGTGVLAALRARQSTPLDVLEQPYLNGPTDALAAALEPYDAVVFADPVKSGQNPLANFAALLQTRRALPRRWRVVAPPPAYNPLGRDFTFLGPDDVAEGVAAVLAD